MLCLGVSLVLVGTLGACTDETMFTDEERADPQHVQAAGGARRRTHRTASPTIRTPPCSGRSSSSTLASPASSARRTTASPNGSLGAARRRRARCPASAATSSTLGGADRRSRTAIVSLGVELRPAQRADGDQRGATRTSRRAAGSSGTAARTRCGRWRSARWRARTSTPGRASSTRTSSTTPLQGRVRGDLRRAAGPDRHRPVPASRRGKPGQASFDGMTAEDKTAINRIYANLGKAIEAYERLLVSPRFEPSPFDRMLDGRRDRDVTRRAIRGAKLFVGKAACNECHRGPTFTDFKFHNIGCPQEGPERPLGRRRTPEGHRDPEGRRRSTARARSAMRPMTRTSLALIDDGGDRDIWARSGRPPCATSRRPAPYMHNGVYTNLWDVVAHYNFGGGTGSLLGHQGGGDLAAPAHQRRDGRPRRVPALAQRRTCEGARPASPRASSPRPCCRNDRSDPEAT